MLYTALSVVLLAAGALAHGDHEHQVPIQGPHKALWYNTLPGDGGTQVCTSKRLLCGGIDVFRPILFSLASQHLVVCHTTPAWHPMM